MNRRYTLLFSILGFLSASLSLFQIANATESAPPMNIHDIKSTELTKGPYSYFVPPYSNYYFHHMDKLDFKLDWIRRAGKVYPLRESKHPFTTNYSYKDKTYTLDQYLSRNAVTGFLILKDNQIIYERYLSGSNRQSRFLTNSVGKSMTSTLVGIALEEGKIKSLDDPIIKYLPWLSDSGFSRATIKQALEMATGVDLTYNPYDPHSSIHQFNAAALTGKPSYHDLLKSVKSNPKVKPGEKFDYENENSQALGFIIEQATGIAFNKYFEKKIWSKIGAESDAFLYRPKAQPNQCAFGCVSATLRDYGRFGLMMMNGGTLANTRVVGSSWIEEATKPTQYPTPIGDLENLGYGYQWWVPTTTDHAYKALGIFGQIIYINPTKHIVIVETAAWPKPEDEDRWQESSKVIDAIVKEID